MNYYDALGLLDKTSKLLIIKQHDWKPALYFDLTEKVLTCLICLFVTSQINWTWKK